ncbi:MAG: hypothetical protein JXR07_20505 [Reichenbachiella sp.]
MKEAIFHLKRDYYGQDSEKRETTLSKMFRPDGSEFGFVLEDVVRAFGIKRMKTSAIPATEGDFTYRLSVENSPKYGRVVTVSTHYEEGMFYLRNGGIEFRMVRCHGGNHADHTDACLLMNRNRETADGKMSAWGSMKSEFAQEVGKLEEQGFNVRLKVTNLPQAS